MLVLSRKVGESIVIEETIEITVTAIQGKYARIAIKAPRAVQIHRKEIHEKICKEKEEAYLKKISKNNQYNEESARKLGMCLNDFVE